MEFYKTSVLCLMAVFLLMDMACSLPTRVHHTREHMRALQTMDAVFTLIEEADAMTNLENQGSGRRRSRRFANGGLHRRRRCLNIIIHREEHSFDAVRRCILYFRRIGQYQNTNVEIIES